MRYLITLAYAFLFVDGGRAQTLVVTPTELTFTTAVDATTLPPPQTFRITASNGGSLPFEINIGPTGSKPSSPWLKCIPGEKVDPDLSSGVSQPSSARR